MVNDYGNQRQQLGNLATKQQMSAANPDMSVWVEASAGTGKTKVLSDRVLRLLLDKVNPQKILCLTYTKAAAVEMNERIAKRLSLWAVEDEESLCNELKKLLGSYPSEELLNFSRTLFATLLDTPGGMKIQTIHSFCQDILKRFPLEAGISPYFEVLDDRSAKEILQEIKADLLKLTDDSQDKNLCDAIKYLTQNVSEYKFPEIMNLITANRSKIANLLKQYNGDIAGISNVLGQKLGIEPSMSQHSIKQDFFDKTNKSAVKAAVDLFAKGGAEDQKRSKAFALVLGNDFNVNDYDTYKAIFLTAEGTIRSRLATKNIINQAPNILDFMTTEAERLLFYENLLTALKVFHSTISALYVAKHIIDSYDVYKEIYAMLDYEDLISITKNLLNNSAVADWVLFKLDGGIDHILIDEAQDTSPDQWAIIRSLTQEFSSGIGQHDEELNRTVFVVGDRKQSIYSFQGADPKEFDKMYHYFSSRIQNFSKVHLDVSFRSTSAIMDCVNTLFETECAKQGVVPQGEHINHRPYRLGDGGKVEIWPLIKSNDEKDKSDYNWILPIVREQKISLSNVLAKQIAQNIKKMVESKDILVSKNRPVQYGDFMFLVQQRNSFVEEFVRACKDIGVKVAGVDKLKLLEQIAVQDLISLGKFLLLTSDDLSLAEVLKSPIFGLDDRDLFKLCYKRDGTLFNQILKNPDYSDLAEVLKSLLNMSGFLRPFELFNHILATMGARKSFISRLGIEVDDVLDEFLNLTIVFEQNHTPTLEAFIAWIVQDEVVIKKEMEQGENDTVKIMTVHGSKGLQSPIVILADSAKTKNITKKSEFLWDEGLMYFPTSSACYDKVCNNIKDKDISASFEEYHRLLYVALTRAEDRLYIAGFTKDADAEKNSWYRLLKDNITSNVTLPEGDERIVYTIPQENICSVEAKPFISEKDDIDYTHLLKPAPIESPLAKPYAPSRDDSDEQDIGASPLADNGRFYKRGTVIHKLLEYISSVDIESREKVSLQFLEQHLPEFSDNERNKIACEVLKLCKTYPEIFSEQSMPEVPIIGEVGGIIISAKVDRLIINQNSVIIVDYKTNRPAAQSLEEVPDLYIKQLHCYKQLLQKIYPTKDIETYILWTNTCNMMKL